MRDLILSSNNVDYPAQITWHLCVRHIHENMASESRIF